MIPGEEGPSPVGRAVDVGHHTLAGALVDRRTHQAHVIQVNGDSCRFQESLPRMSSGATPGGGEAEGGALPQGA
jgi:hypothetical protein